MKKKKKNIILLIGIVEVLLVLAVAWLYAAPLIFKSQPENNIGQSKIEEQSKSTISPKAARNNAKQIAALTEKVVPSEGVVLPVSWGNLGAQLVKDGVIDKDKFETLYQQRGSFTQEYKDLLLGNNKGQLKITRSNSGYLLNLFWALGLANKNPILDEMTKSVNGRTQDLAATGGWTIAKGNPMKYYNHYKLLNLTTKQQALVDKVSNGIYRPCCGNSAHFPGCNHGMAMLGFLELMASQGASEQAMWNAALTVNSYWFPNTYLTIATYMNNNGIDWKKINPQGILGHDYSSAQGYARIASQTIHPQSGGNSGSGCGVGAGVAAPPIQASNPQSGGNNGSGCGVSAGITPPTQALNPQPIQKQQGGCGI